METRIDLDLAAAEIEQRRGAWEKRGLSVGTLTWRDQARRWPDQIVESRQESVDPDSIRVLLERGAAAAAEVVLYRGGWADVTRVNVAAPDDRREHLTAHCDLSPQSFGELRDDFVSSFIANSDRWPAP